MAEELGIEVLGHGTGLYGEAHVTGVDEAVTVSRTMGPGDAALVKGSRVGRLEDVVRAYGEAEAAPSVTASAAAAAGAGTRRAPAPEVRGPGNQSSLAQSRPTALRDLRPALPRSLAESVTSVEERHDELHVIGSRNLV